MVSPPPLSVSVIRANCHVHQGLGCVWLGVLGVSLLLSAQAASRRAMQVEEYPQQPTRRRTLPAEMSDARAWGWADRLTGTRWYYADKPAFKIGFSDTETRALVDGFVCARGAPPDVLRESLGRQGLRDAIAAMGGARTAG